MIDPARHIPVGLTAASSFPQLLNGAETALLPEQAAALEAEMRRSVATVHVR
ncbi:MAG: hypothetical protein BWY76_01534 [bacterium ADurb.Bin429]|nr:MAG: hypothetical protein BWY76_01534 [bacterium ADurb.Bin429]